MVAVPFAVVLSAASGLTVSVRNSWATWRNRCDKRRRILRRRKHELLLSLVLKLCVQKKEN